MSITLRFPNRRAYVPIARAAIEASLSSLGLTERKSGEFIFAVGEALANAVEHGFRDDGYVTISIRRVPAPRAVVVDVEDDGPGFNADVVSRSDENNYRGFGLRIMAAMADRIEFSDDGRRVRLWKLQAVRPQRARRVSELRLLAPEYSVWPVTRSSSF